MIEEETENPLHIINKQLKKKNMYINIKKVRGSYSIVRYNNKTNKKINNIAIDLTEDETIRFLLFGAYIVYLLTFTNN